MSNDIELDVSRHGDRGRYQVRVVRSPAGGDQREEFDLDVDGLLRSRPQLEAAILSSAVGARRTTSTVELPVREVGRHLFETLFTRSVYGAYRASLGVAQEQGQRLRVVLRLSAPELAALPWEALFDPERQTYVCRHEPMVRRVPAQFNPRAPLQVAPPLEVLAIIASPRGLVPLNVELERANLEEALQELTVAGLVRVTWVEPASWRSVHRHLISGHWHVVHFIGHGDYDESRDEGVLAFVDPDGRPDMVEAGRFADLLGEADPTPRLVVLNACSTGESRGDDMLSATAPALVHSGIEAVAAMQFAVSDDAAIAFAQGFYTAVAHSRGVDEAARSGRIAILGAAGSLEWLTPVLYLRGDSTHPLVMRPVAPVDRPVPQPGPDPEPDVEAKQEPEIPRQREPRDVVATTTIPLQEPDPPDPPDGAAEPDDLAAEPGDLEPPPDQPPPGHLLRRVLAAGAVLALAVAAVVVWRSGSGPGSGPGGGASRLDDSLVLVPEKQSPQGRTRLWTFDTDTLDTRPWAGPADEFDAGTTPDDVDRFSATPSTDRTQVAYLEGAEGGLPVPYVADSDGRNARRLMTSEQRPCDNTKRPAWDQDGRRLAVVCVFPPDSSGNWSWSMSIVSARDGAEIREVVPQQQGWNLGAPTWDEENHLLYTWRADPPRPEQNLGTLGTPASVRDDGTGPPQDVPGTDGDTYTEPDWGPEGLLTVRHVEDADNEVVVVTDGRPTVVATGDYRAAAWGPDDRSIVATRGLGRAGAELVVLRLGADNTEADGTGVTGRFGAPTWGTR